MEFTEIMVAKNFNNAPGDWPASDLRHWLISQLHIAKILIQAHGQDCSLNEIYATRIGLESCNIKTN
jgi:hypothetical protein